jgi:hypothetical protein
VNCYQKKGITPWEQYTSTNARYAKGYKHRSVSLNLRWFNKMVYVSEYDPQFYKEREEDITQDISKKVLFSVEQPQLACGPFLQPPAFLQVNGIIPELQVQLNSATNPIFAESNSLECGWITLKW